MSKRPRVALGLASLLLLAGALSGCSSGPEQSWEDDLAFLGGGDRNDRSICPKAEIVRELRRLYRFPAGSTPAAGAELFSATLTGITADCTVDAAGAKVRIGLTIAGRRGAALVLPYGEHGSSVEAVYFAAVIDPAGRIIDKTMFPARLDFKDGLRPTATENLEQRIAAAPEELGQYRIGVGLQMAPEEIAFVRTKEAEE